MNRKAQANGLGLLIAIAVVAIVAVVLMTASAQNLEVVRNTHDVANATQANANATYNFSGCQAISSVVAYNSTDDVIIGSGNYTVTNYQVVNGEVVAQLEVGAEIEWQGDAPAGNWNLSYTCEPYGYADSGGRTIAGLIIIFGMLAIAVVVMTPTLRSGILGALGR